MTILPLVAIAWLLTTSGGQGTGAQTRLEDQLTTYHLVLLKRGPGAGAPDDGGRIQAAHIAHLESLAARGFGMAAGPLGDGGEIRGIVILRTDSAQQAEALASEDPAVRAGRLVVEVLPFMAPPGWFGKPAEPFEPEHLFFGFLVNGRDRSQDVETARQLQKQHLAYLNQQAGEGKLVLAGPILRKDGVRRGVIAYRVPTIGEARARAEEDPMVKAGRLAVELHPWMTAKGILR